MSRNRWPAWLKDLVLRYKKAVALALVLGIAAAACSVLLMFTSGYLISATALATTTLFSMMVPIACVQLFGFGRPLARYLERLASHNWVLKITSDLRLSLFRSVEERTGDPARQRAVGEYLGILSDDVAHLQNLYLRVVFPTIIAYALALGTSLFFGFFSVSFALVMAVSFTVVAIVLPLVTLVATRKPTVDIKDARADTFVSLTDDILGATDWICSGRQDDVKSRHESADATICSAEERLRLGKRGITLASSLLMGVLSCVVIGWAGDTFGTAGGNVNWIAAFALGFFALVESFTMLPVALSESTVHRESVTRLDEYVCATPVRTIDAQRAELPYKPGNALELEDVSYTYPAAARAAINGVSLTFPTSCRVAILGRSGAGKSTLGSLIAGIITPDSGDVRTAGRIRYLDQTPYLFNRSLRENLTLGAPSATDEELGRVLGAVGLAEFLAALPHGLDTVIGQTGIGTSTGEAHRIACARVLLSDAPVIVVDEPFSALDPKTERALLDTMLDVFADRCLLVITHHLTQIERFDRVIFIDGGGVALDGSPDELKKTNEEFRTLLSFDRSR